MEDEAFEDFWGRYLDREDDLPPDLLAMSRDVEEIWFAFDCEMDDGSRVVDDFLAQVELDPGERSFLLAMRESTMRLYEVTESVPGSSMTLRDLVEGTTVRVHERMVSKTIARGECLAARVISRGCFGSARDGARGAAYSGIVAIMDDVAHAPGKSVHAVREIPGNLFHPRAVRLARDACDLNPPGPRSITNSTK